MTGGSERDGGGDEKVREDAGDAGERAPREETLALDVDVNNLMNALAAVARQDEAELSLMPDALVPSLSDSQRDQLVGRILRAQAQQQQDRQQDLQAVARADGDPEEGDALARRRAARGPRRRAFVVAGGGSVLLAAAAMMTLWLRSSGGLPALPGYALSVSGGVAELRGAPSDTARGEGVVAAGQRVRADTELRIVCRPDTAIVGPIAVRVFFVQGEILDELHPVVRVAVTGAAEVRVRGAELLARHRGRGSLRILVGRPDAVRDHGTTETEQRRALTVPLALDAP